MRNVVLIHANCHNFMAKGDFAFAGNLARDFIGEKQLLQDIEVVLVSTHDGVASFESIYGPAINGKITIEGAKIGLSSLETFNAIDNSVIAFIDASRCKYSEARLVKRVLSPESKLLFVESVTHKAFADLSMKQNYLESVQKEQPGVYKYFSKRDTLIESAGLGANRLGLPRINKAADLPCLSIKETALLPAGDYGFMYLAELDKSKDYKLIAQYIKLSGHDRYILIGNFVARKDNIRYAYEHDNTLVTSKEHLPQIDYHLSLPNHVMRNMLANSAGLLVLSTGSSSTLEAMKEGKLAYYQDIANNGEFVASCLIAIKSIAANDNSLAAPMVEMIIELSSLLFAPKPLSKENINRTQALLQMPAVSSGLARINQMIIEQENGKIAGKLLNFIGSPRKTTDKAQLAKACKSLRKEGESASPVYREALQRAARWGRLFELKVLIKSMPSTELNETDSLHGRTALHWAVASKQLDCARLLVNAGACLDIPDKKGKIALQQAKENSDGPMMRMLIDAKAERELNSSITPTS